MIDYKLLSADCHIVEHSDAFLRCQKEFGDRAPRVVKDPQGLAKGLWYIMDGLEPMHVGYFALGHVIDKPEGRKNIEMYGNSQEFKRQVNDFVENYTFEDFREDWDAPAYLKALDRDNVEATIIYASWARYNYAESDAKLQRSILNSYNEWIMDFASYAPKRLHPAPMISILDIDLAVKDMENWVKRGCKTVHIPTTIIGSGYYEPQYERLWAAAVDLDIPLSVHANSSQGRPMKLHGVKKREFDPKKYVVNAKHDGLGGTGSAWEFVSNLMFSGVFDRYPSLKVVAAEFKMDNAAHTYEMIDYNMGRLSTYDPESNLYKRSPSEYLLNNCFFSFEESRAIVLTAPLYGENNYMWGSDFPHFQSVWPYSTKLVSQACKGLDPAIVHKLARDNTQKIYKLI